MEGGRGPSSLVPIREDLFRSIPLNDSYKKEYLIVEQGTKGDGYHFGSEPETSYFKTTTLPLSHWFSSVLTGWFRNSTGDISDKYYVSITPAGWAFSIWSVIYIWQAIWIIYVIANIFRTNKFGKVYLNPPTVPAAFLATYSINLVLNIAWLFTWDRQYIPVAFAVLALIAFTAYVCLVISYRAVDKHIDQLCEHHKVDLWLNSIFIQNGILIYATWCTIATLLNFSMVLTYFADVDEEIACIISLSILTAELVLYFIVDIFLLERHLRSAFMVYPVVIWASTAVLVNNWDPNSKVSIFTAVVVGLACAAFVGKQIKQLISCCRKDTSVNNGDKMTMKDVA